MSFSKCISLSFQICRSGEIQSKIFNFLVPFTFCDHFQLILRAMLSFLGKKISNQRYNSEIFQYGILNCLSLFALMMRVISLQHHLCFHRPRPSFWKLELEKCNRFHHLGSVLSCITKKCNSFQPKFSNQLFTSLGLH